MAKILHPKVLELKKRASAIQYTTVSADMQESTDYPASDFPKRIVAGYGVNWGVKNDYDETFVKGSASKSISERGPNANAKMPIKFLNFHNQTQVNSLFERLEENDIGLYFRTVPLDNVDWADDTLTQLRTKSLNNFSIGWNYVWDKIEWDDKSESLIILEMELYEISVVSLASDWETCCLRAGQSYDDAALDLNDEIESFIKTIPRKDQLRLRSLLTRQKSLSKLEPNEEKRNSLKDKKPAEMKRKLNYLLKNF